MTFPRLNSGLRLSILSAALDFLDFKEISCSLSFKSHPVVDGRLVYLCLRKNVFTDL